MKKLLLAALAAFGILSAPAHAAQDQVLAFVVVTCGTLATPYIAGKYGILTMDVNGKLCDSSTGGGGGGGAVTLASGAVASGAYSAGSIAAGALVAGAALDGWNVTQGTKADAKNTATDTTAVSEIAIMKEISFMEQTPASRAVTNAGTFAVQLSGATNNINNIAGTISLPTGAATQTTLASVLAVQGATTDAPCTLPASATACTMEALAKAQANAIISPIAAAVPPFAPIGGVVAGPFTHNNIAASQTAQTLNGASAGATGNYLSHCVITPLTTSPGAVTVFDNTSTAANNAVAFVGGASSVSNLVPFSIPVGANSANGPWKGTTGTNVIVDCYVHN